MVWMCSLILAILHGSGRSAAAAIRRQVSRQGRNKKNYCQMHGSRAGKKRGEEEEGK
jgi:hypothetical protein